MEVCKNINYTILDDAKRNRNYNNGDASPRCDRSTVEGTGRVVIPGIASRSQPEPNWPIQLSLKVIVE